MGLFNHKKLQVDGESTKYDGKGQNKHMILADYGIRKGDIMKHT